MLPIQLVKLDWGEEVVLSPILMSIYSALLTALKNWKNLLNSNGFSRWLKSNWKLRVPFSAVASFHHQDYLVKCSNLSLKNVLCHHGISCNCPYYTNKHAVISPKYLCHICQHFTRNYSTFLCLVAQKAKQTMACQGKSFFLFNQLLYDYTSPVLVGCLDLLPSEREHRGSTLKCFFIEQLSWCTKTLAKGAKSNASISLIALLPSSLMVV